MVIDHWGILSLITFFAHYVALGIIYLLTLQFYYNGVPVENCGKRWAICMIFEGFNSSARLL